MGGLNEVLKRRIALQGPITVADFMNEALHHPRFGYYATRDPLGADGDFITAPEISQVFGELIGLWLAVVWQGMRGPEDIALIELGPGRGTLMADALRAAKAVPGFRDAVRPHLIERNPVLRNRQANLLAECRLKFAPTWHNDLETVPDGPALLIANEFFDALPMRQFQKSETGWHERLVTADNDGLAFVLSPVVPEPPLLNKELLDAATGSICEVCPAALSLAHTIAGRLCQQGGTALIIDYGYFPSQPGETFQAMRSHGFAPVLENPGDSDLTAHVDFDSLIRAAREAGASAFGPIPQGAFLTRLGLNERCAALMASASPEQSTGVEAARNRLGSSEQMGQLFKAIAIQHPSLPAPPAFE